MGVTQAEFDEVTHVAMTVGATRMQVMHRNEATALESETQAERTGLGSVEDRASAPGNVAPENAVSSPTFQAQEVVAQATGG
jgi:hypothetical protein